MPPGPIGRGPGLCPRGGAGAAYLPANVLCSPAHRLWGRAFALPFGVGGGRFFGATKRPLRTAGAERRQWRKKRGGSPVRKGVAGSCLGVGEKPSGGGRRLGAKRPERAWPGAFGPGPRSFVWLAGGRPCGAAPPAAKRRRPPPYLRPGPPAPPTGPPDRPWATVPRGQGAALGPGGGGGVRGPGPWPSNKPAAGLRPAAGGWAAPTRRRPPRSRAFAEGRSIDQRRIPTCRASGGGRRKKDPPPSMRYKNENCH